MNFDLSDDQEILRSTFARFLDENSSTARVRAALQSGGFDRALWSGLGELGAFAIRVPETAGGLGLGLYAYDPWYYGDYYDDYDYPPPAAYDYAPPPAGAAKGRGAP